MLAVFQVALLKEAKTRAGRGLRFGLGIFHGLHEGSKATPGGSWVTWGLIVTMTWLRSVPGGTHSCWQRPFAMVCKRRRCALDEMRLLGSWINCIKQSNLTIDVVYIRLITRFLCPGGARLPYCFFPGMGVNPVSRSSQAFCIACDDRRAACQGDCGNSCAVDWA